MGLEQRGNNFYYYRKRRVGRRVRTEYVGGGELAHLISCLEKLEREQRDEERRREKARRAELKAGDQALDEFDTLISTLVQGILVAGGYHTHKGQWRRKRHGKQQS